MNLQEFRGAVQEAVRAGFLARLEDYLAKVDVEGSIEDRRKAVELTSKLADAMPDKEAGHTYPVVHISFGAGGVTAKVAPVVEVVDAAPLELNPTPHLKQHLGVNLEVEELLREST